MQHERVYPVACSLRVAFLLDDGVKNTPHLTLRCFQRSGVFGIELQRVIARVVMRRKRRHRIELLDQRSTATGLDRDGFNDRNAEFGLQPGDIDHNAALLRNVHHVQRQYRRALQAQYLKNEAQIQL